MDASRFAAISRSLSATPTRRLTMRALAALGVVAVSGSETAAKKKRGKKKCKCKDKDNGPSCPATPCAPDCTGKACGPDGCGDSCGACNGGTCRDGTCDCSANDTETEFCGGDCVPPCDATERRNPFSCDCCIANDEPSGSCITGIPNACCSGICDIVSGNCIGSNGTCQFDAQCQSLNCQANGTCAI